MRYFDKNRRRLIKPQYIRGLKKTEAGTSKLMLENAVKAHIPYLEIVGKTVQDGTPTPETPIPIQNANDNGMIVVLHGTNLATAYQIFADRNKYTELEFDGRECICYQCDKATEKVIVGGFKENTQYTLSCDAYVIDARGSDRAYLSVIYYTDGTTSAWYTDKRNVWTKSSFTTESGKTVQAIGMKSWAFKTDIYIDVNTFQINEGTQVLPYESYFEPKIIEIPTSVGTLTTELTEYDKLTVDRLNNKVVYTKGSHTYEYKGTENITLDPWSSGLGYGNYYRTSIATAFDLPDVIACTHFKKGRWTQSTIMITQTNVVCSASNYLFFFKTDGVQTVEDFKAFLQEQYANGTPVTLVCQRRNPIEHDITNTDLGQALLSIATGQGTNYLEIVGGLETGALNVTYYSESEEDQVNLTIKYTCGDREIKEPWVQEIRKGSKYLIASPHIDGYTRISSEVYGVADESTTIELNYKEEEDATV